MIPQFDLWGEIKKKRKKKIRSSLLKPLPCISITLLFSHSWGKKPSLQQLGWAGDDSSPCKGFAFAASLQMAMRYSVKCETTKQQGPTPHTGSPYLCLKRRRRQGNEMPDSCSDRMRNITDSIFNINPYAFCYVQLPCSTAACSPF